MPAYSNAGTLADFAQSRQIPKGTDRIIDHILLKNADCDGYLSSVGEAQTERAPAQPSNHPPYRGHSEFKPMG